MLSVPTCPPKGGLPALVAGQEVPIGHFFWIKTCLGFAENAKHGHNSFDRESPGSADVDCKVRVLKEEGGIATVVLLRPRVPFGAPAPHGTIFMVPTEEILRWPAETAERFRKEKLQNDVRRSLGRVVV